MRPPGAMVAAPGMVDDKLRLRETDPTELT